ncbi:MAG: efflux RND transporter periplasmic adaptor subunit [Spirochaetaceae bacterium]|nr:efflux RND transporter periplasmic adaptor subunit [Spirochaetaceae bacterium]
MKKKIKIIIICVFVLVIIGAALVVLRTILGSKSNEKVFYTANVETYENVIEISGTVAAAQEQTLQALSAGTVTEVLVKAGDKVKKGDIILKLDDSEQIYNLEKHDYNMATKQFSASARELKLMQTERNSILQKVNDRKVIATFDGIIADLKVAVGDSLEAKDKIGTLVNTDYLTAEVEVTETDVAKLSVGQKVIFKFPAYTKGTVEGYVTGWPAIGSVTSRGATVVNVSLRIDNYPDEILPYFSFTGKIEISPTESYVVVSRYAIGYENKEPYVVLAKGEQKKTVKVEPYGREYVKVLEGLEGGEVLLQQTAPKLSGMSRNKNTGMPAAGSKSGGTGMPPAGGFGGGMPSGGMPPSR